MEENIFVKKFVSQKCLGYSSDFRSSRWYMIADFTDGKRREWTGWLQDQVVHGLHGVSPSQITPEHTKWTVIPKGE
jgi:hypothetical protein